MPVNPIDPYTNASGGGDAAKFDATPPTPGAPTNDPNLVSIFVPSETTSLDYGSGDPPGVRVATDNHVHFTARTPLTTISLGSPGGDGVSVPSPGLQITSAGEKLEHIVQRVRIVYDATEDAVIGTGRTHFIAAGGDKLEVAAGDRVVNVDTGNHATNVKLLTSIETDNYEAHARYDVHLTGDRKIQVKQGATVATFEAGNVELEAAGHVMVHHAGTTVLIDAGGKVTVTAEPQIDINCQGALVTMSGGKIAMTAPSEIMLGVGSNGIKISSSGVGDHRVEREVDGHLRRERDHRSHGEAQLSALAPLPSHHVYALLDDDVTWFFRTPEVRVLHVATGATERPVALHQLTLSEGHAFNHSPFFVLEDAHSTIEPRWLARAERMAVIHAERRKLLAEEGMTLAPLPALVHGSSDIAAFAEQLLQALTAQQNEPLLEGLVVVLAPSILEDSGSFTASLLALLQQKSLAEVRWIVLELGDDVARGFVAHQAWLGPARSVRGGPAHLPA